MIEKPFLPEEGRFNGIAKPTRWNGIIYRSRLEARWAVFFDALNPRLPYEYEPEWFDTSHGPYLPDFYLPTLNYFWIVKPQQISNLERAKCAEICQKGFNVYIAQGPIPQSFSCPWEESGFIGESYMYHSPITNDLIEAYKNDLLSFGNQDINSMIELVDKPSFNWDNFMAFCQRLDTKEYGIEFEGRWERIRSKDHQKNTDDKGHWDPQPNIDNALDIARNYRFDRRD